MNWVLRLSVFTVFVGTACGPTLRHDERFTARRVRAAVFSDTCHLQSYFNEDPPPLKLLNDQNVSADASLAWGRATYRIENPVAQDELLRIVRQTYRRVKIAARPAKTVEIDVRYHILQGRRQLPIGARSIIRGLGPEPLDLPYHPCLGAFVFGRQAYALRRRLVEKR